MLEAASAVGGREELERADLGGRLRRHRREAPRGHRAGARPGSTGASMRPNSPATVAGRRIVEDLGPAAGNRELDELPARPRRPGAGRSRTTTSWTDAARQRFRGADGRAASAAARELLQPAVRGACRTLSPRADAAHEGHARRAQTRCSSSANAAEEPDFQGLHGEVPATFFPGKPADPRPSSSSRWPSRMAQMQQADELDDPPKPAAPSCKGLAQVVAARGPSTCAGRSTSSPATSRARFPNMPWKPQHELLGRTIRCSSARFPGLPRHARRTWTTSSTCSSRRHSRGEASAEVDQHRPGAPTSSATDAAPVHSSGLPRARRAMLEEAGLIEQA